MKTLRNANVIAAGAVTLYRGESLQGKVYFAFRRDRRLQFADWPFTSRSKSRMASSFAVARAADGWRFQPGCSIGQHAPGCVLRSMPMST